MCLAIPAKIESIDETRTAQVSVLGVTRVVALDLVPHAAVGSYVLVHAGYAIEVVDETIAQETLDLIAEFPELAQGV
ncbi:MAG: HypC/HybG/HupF family hydrogenase formation chaperone [Coriobacteriia bacterium]|nr:HypC/HybG/HupF family hydrogenase formation chaperone [Coriobacteriia bacterium]